MKLRDSCIKQACFSLRIFLLEIFLFAYNGLQENMTPYHHQYPFYSLRGSRGELIFWEFEADIGQL